MLGNAYEEAIIGSMPRYDRPPQPNVIELARKAIGRDNFRSEPNGAYYVWADGRWNGPLKLDGLMRAANEKLKRDGKPQITTNPAWVIGSQP